jgi:ABC-type uncharacterized transport system substrate-binding protein
VALFTPSALAAKRATSEIPIVFQAGDAVGTGGVPSLARPAGNLTGLSVMAAELQGKCVEPLHDMLPFVRRVAALRYSADPFSKPFVDQVQLAGRATGNEINPIIMLNGPDEIHPRLTQNNYRTDPSLFFGRKNPHVAKIASDSVAFQSGQPFSRGAMSSKPIEFESLVATIRRVFAKPK